MVSSPFCGRPYSTKRTVPAAAVPSVDMLIDGLLDADDPVLALVLALGQQPRGLAPVPPIYSNDRDAQTVLDLCGLRFRWQHVPTRLAKERRGVPRSRSDSLLKGVGVAVISLLSYIVPIN